MGQLEQTTIAFDLDRLVANNSDLAFLEHPFTHAEIDDVVAEFPHNKSPGPEGSNAEFLQNVGRLLRNISMTCVISFIKEAYACRASIAASLPLSLKSRMQQQYMIIGLFHCLIVLWSYSLNFWLIVMQLIHANHYGFIKSRTIQDCLAWSFEYLHMRHQFKAEDIILKLDFKKASDKVEHSLIQEVLKKRFWY